MTQAPAALSVSTPKDAASWDARLRSPLCDEADRAEFRAWYEAALENQRAFDDLHSKIRALQDAATVHPDLRAIHDRVRVLGVRRRRKRLHLTAIACSLAGVMVVVGAYLSVGPMFRANPASVYRTMAGEQSTIRLADGSQVTLNSRTELRVEYGSRARLVTLNGGEALFEVAKEQGRPFIVSTGRRQVVAVGTAFDIRLEADRLRVTMLEGKASVRATGAWRTPPADLMLVAGQRMVAATDSPEAEIQVADLAKDTGWREGRVIFEGETLLDAVAEMNRYAEKPIIIGDSGLNSLIINGMFRTSQPDNFVTALTTYYSIEARPGPAGETLLTRR
jgi:transmembrane sensor